MVSLHVAAFRYTPTGFRFRYRKVWGFKSLLVHSLALWASGALAEPWSLRLRLRRRLREQVPALRANGQQPFCVSACAVGFVSKSLLVGLVRFISDAVAGSSGAGKSATRNLLRAARFRGCRVTR